MSIALLAAAAAAATVGPACSDLPLTPNSPIPPPVNRARNRSAPPYGDALGDAWEMQEVSCWRGIWTMRPDKRRMDGYWFHPNGERVRAELELWVDGRSVIVVRRHRGGKYCRYDG